MNKILLPLIFGVFLSSVMLAQDKVISGIVIDSLTQEPLPFANVGVVGRQMGSISNSEGNYTLSLHDLVADDTICFSFIGYKDVRCSVTQLENDSRVQLGENTIQLFDFTVASRDYTPVEILDSLKANFSANHYTKYVKQQMFHRDASFFTIHNVDVQCKKTSFDAIDKQFIDDLNDEIPENLNNYSDYLVDMLYSDSASILMPIEGQSLVEDWDFNDKFSESFESSMNDLKEDYYKEDTYFKVRTGIIGGRVKIIEDSVNIEADDSLSYTKTTDRLKDNLNMLTEQSSIITSEKLDFFQKYKSYSYTLKDISVVNGELAYVIAFVPAKRKGSYTGTICVATENFALLQVDYAYAEGKTGRDISVLGVEYLEVAHNGRVIFEKGDNGYYLKYLSDEYNQRYGISRGLTLKQKHDGKLRNKTLQEIKLHLDLDLTSLSKDEVLVVSQQKISQDEFDMAIQPDTMKLKKVSVYAPGIWKSNSIIEPTKALKEYQRQF